MKRKRSRDREDGEESYNGRGEFHRKGCENLLGSFEMGEMGWFMSYSATSA